MRVLINKRSFEPCMCLDLVLNASGHSCFKFSRNIEIRFVIGSDNIVLAGVCVHFSARKFYRLGTEWVRMDLIGADLNVESIGRVSRAALKLVMTMQ